MMSTFDKIQHYIETTDAIAKQEARRQYEETYRRMRTTKKSIMTNDELRSQSRTAALNASKSYTMARRPCDKIEYMQIKLANAKERAAIRKSNEKFFSQRPDLEDLCEWLYKTA